MQKQLIAAGIGLISAFSIHGGAFAQSVVPGQPPSAAECIVLHKSNPALWEAKCKPARQPMPDGSLATPGGAPYVPPQPLCPTDWIYLPSNAPFGTSVLVAGC